MDDKMGKRSQPNRRDMSHDEWDHDMYMRMGSVESDVANLRGDIGSLSHRMEEGFNSTSRSISRIVEELSQRGRVNWPLVTSVIFGVLSAMGAICTGLVILGTLALKPIEGKQVRYRDDFLRLEERLRDHENSNGHLGLTQRVSALERVSEDLDKDLQMEMRSLDEAQNQRLNALDTALQREMRMADETLEANTVAADKRFERLQQEFDRHREDFSRLSEKLNRIEYLRGYKDGSDGLEQSP